MHKILSCFTLLILVVLTLGACSAPSSSVMEQRQTTEVEQYSSDSGGQQKQCNHSVVIQNNGKTETHQSSKC
ncbi:hypothetical protein G7B40_009975 [Aetokthonos hydrillicola Thurmond2011]|uniref:Uncharacterized protein n=1 Tax=Aetokthonos hydrillicola Thurmond2011 TaxID=2712845 RepID=A0AAP5M4J5_9CYAN|nr:hypothetical protein [Aetokthonos hydrillicola]MBW4590056.1 hypothetical protein [Aetokthonos hydrillicola CCALA 1050]MDR9894891.1 hypothetical protein [Aetokthonos hydrillicola Thurmond2011]